MKTNRLPTLYCGLFLLGLSAAAAARGPADRLVERLDLDAQQQARITALIEEHRAYMAEDFEWRDADGRPDPEARARVEAARDALDAEIRAVLDAEQIEAYDQLKDRMQRHRARQRGGRQLMHALGQLDLSEPQKDALRVLRAEHRAERAFDREQFRNDLSSILSDEQLAQLAAMRERNGRAHRGR